MVIASLKHRQLNVPHRSQPQVHDATTNFEESHRIYLIHPKSNTSILRPLITYQTWTIPENEDQHPENKGPEGCLFERRSIYQTDSSSLYSRFFRFFETCRVSGFIFFGFSHFHNDPVQVRQEENSQFCLHTRPSLNGLGISISREAKIVLHEAFWRSSGVSGAYHGARRHLRRP